MELLLMVKFKISDSMKIATIWVAWTFLAIGAVGWSLFVVLCYFGVEDTAAAWVQAVGSVGAIAVAVWISRLEAQRSRDERLLEAFLYIEKAFSVAVYAVEGVKAVADYVLQGQPTEEMLEYHVSLLNIATADLDEIKFADLDNQMAAGAFLAIRRAANLTKFTITMQLRTSAGFKVAQVQAWKRNVDDELGCMEQGMRAYLTRHPQVLDEITFPRF